MKVNDEDFVPDDEDEEDDFTFSQNAGKTLNLPGIEQKRSGNILRDEQNQLPSRVEAWLTRCVNTESSPLYQAFTFEHMLFFRKHLKTAKYAGTHLYMDKFTLLDGEPDTWPKISDLPFTDPMRIGHDCPIKKGEYPRDQDDKYIHMKKSQKTIDEEKAMLEGRAIAVALATTTGKPTTTLTFVVYKEIDRAREERHVQVMLEIGNNKTLQDVYDDQRVRDGPRKWPEDVHRQLVNGDKKLKIRIIDQGWEKQYFFHDLSDLKEMKVDSMVQDLPKDALLPVHFVLAVVDSVAALPGLIF